MMYSYGEKEDGKFYETLKALSLWILSYNNNTELNIIWYWQMPVQIVPSKSSKKKQTQ